MSKRITNSILIIILALLTVLLITGTSKIHYYDTYIGVSSNNMGVNSNGVAGGGTIKEFEEIIMMSMDDPGEKFPLEISMRAEDSWGEAPNDAQYWLWSNGLLEHYAYKTEIVYEKQVVKDGAEYWEECVVPEFTEGEKQYRVKVSFRQKYNKRTHYYDYYMYEEAYIEAYFKIKRWIYFEG